MKIILGSCSKQRKDIMDFIGLDYEVIKSDIDENSNCTIPYEYVMDLSRQKALAIKSKVDNDSLIITCDTVVYFNNKIFEKPKSLEEARNNLISMIGKETTAYTGCTIIDTKNNNIVTFYDKAVLKLRDDISIDEVDWYVNNEETILNRCGYSIPGKAIIFIDKIVGDYNTILGLCASSLIKHLKDMGYPINSLIK